MADFWDFGILIRLNARGRAVGSKGVHKMDYVISVISLLGGLAMFLYGMKLMGNNLKESASGTLKVAIGKVTDNAVKAFFLGVAITAIIQSSTATIVITSGLVAAGVISLDQSLGIVIGSNVGTTVTGQIIRLLDLDAKSGSILQFFQPSTLAPLALIIGIILIMGFNFKRSDSIGNIAIGFGILFTGLLNMTAAVEVFSDTGVIDVLFENMGNNPLIGYFTGAGIAFVLQSSSATIGMLQAFSQAGDIPFSVVYVVLVGIYLGDCVTTAIVCSIGAKSDAKRVGVVNILFNLSETVLVLIVVTILHNVGLLDNLWTKAMHSGNIANTNSIFNLGCAILLLPLVSVYKKLALRIVKDESEAAGKYADKITELNPVFYRTPAIAFGSCYDVLNTMFCAAKSNIEKAFDVIENYDDDITKEIFDEEENIDHLTDCVDKYLIQLSPYVSEDLHVRILKQYHKLVSEFEHLGDYACGLAKAANQMNEENISFTDTALNEIRLMKEIVDELLMYTQKTFEKRDVSSAYHIEPLADTLNDLAPIMQDNHLTRLRENVCTVRAGVVFANIIANIQGIGRTCSNVGVSTIVRAATGESGYSHTANVHQGMDEKYNKEYKEVSERYNKKLEGIG